MVNAIPDNYPRLSTYVVVDGANDAITFYQNVFGAKLRGEPMAGPDGVIGHAELDFAGSLVMIADAASNPMLDGTPAPGEAQTLCLYVEDADAVFAAAVDKGATQLTPVEDQFYGDRSGAIRDPWGIQWSIMTHIEDVTPEMMAQRLAALEQTA